MNLGLSPNDLQMHLPYTSALPLCRLYKHTTALVTPCTTILARITGGEDSSTNVPQNGLDCKTRLCDQRDWIIMILRGILTFGNALWRKQLQC